MTDETDGTTDAQPGQAVDILLAEDNPTDVEMTRRAFDDVDLPVALHVVNDGVEALASLRGEGEYADTPRPDIVLLDLEMPRMDGKEVLAELESEGELSRIPVVVLTSSEAEQDIVDSYSHSANAYMTKPIVIRRLQKLLCQLIPGFRAETV